MKMYVINEIFYSLQGEGVRTGCASVFVRFTGCNRRCTIEPGPKSIGGFDCDTEYVSGRRMTAEEILDEVVRIGGPCRWIVFTGGEPGLQLDKDLIRAARDREYSLAAESNGSVELPDGLTWVTVSPKVAEHAIKQLTATEVKYVRGYGQAIPKPVIEAQYHLISPATRGQEIDIEALEWCIDLVRQNPGWRLSVQQHKLWRIQ